MGNGNEQKNGLQKLHEQSRQPASIRMVLATMTIILAAGGIITWALTAQSNIQLIAKTASSECMSAHISSAQPHPAIETELARHESRLDSAERDIDELEKGTISRQSQLNRIEEILNEVRASLKILEHAP